MRNVQVDENGELQCWNCGARAFTHKRTFRSKALGVTAAPLTGGLSLAAPLGTKKKLKCQSCGKYNDVDTADKVPGAPSSGHDPSEISNVVASKIGALQALDLKGDNWTAFIDGEAFRVIAKAPASLSVMFGMKDSHNETVIPLDEIIDSWFRPASLVNTGWLTVLTRSAPRPAQGLTNMVEDPNSLQFWPSQQSICEQLHEVFQLVGEMNNLRTQGVIGREQETPDPASTQAPTVAERLATLKDLHAQGLIDDEQLAARQQAILDDV